MVRALLRHCGVLMSSIARTCSAATRKYERLACVGIIQRRGCMRANEYRGYERKYELLACYCVAALTGNVGLRWRLSPRPAGLRCTNFSRMRESCAQGGGASGRDPAALAPGAMMTTRLLIRKRGRDTAVRAVYAAALPCSWR